MLLNRCRLSVLAQTYPNIEHVIVQDGPGDPELEDAVKATSREGNRVVFLRLGRNWRQYSHGACVGSPGRLVATYVCTGEFIGYLDDDDEYLPEHVEKLVRFIEQQQLDWAYSIFKRFWSDGRKPDLIGHRVEYGCIGTPCIFHRTHCLLHGNWSMDGYSEDFRLADKWRRLKHARLAEVTIHVHKQV